VDAIQALRLKVRIPEGKKANFRIPTYSENAGIGNTKGALRPEYQALTEARPAADGPI
jgi:hypothetical protein